ncbi:ATP-binding protein [Streptomyces sp. NBC_01142]|uniref:AAA family ATPase n=1 Tax=Streptomyces sp. NBC_01142 TaxID=2975865 RepID=UPI002259A163|nr:AAA family ATPase [Streptomyces sp. NBC_01142]MCX4826152.1 ATP-binding protein [Streptomyces sp. NBC_01142]
MLVALGGRPFTGKSTLARALAEAIPGVLLDKAALRKVLFPERVVVSPELNDRLYEWLLQAASWHLDTTPGAVIVLDGRPLTQARDVWSLRRFASNLGHALQIVECVCPEKVALERANAGPAEAPGVQAPPADLRGESADPIPDPKIVVDTRLPVEQCVSTALDRVVHQPCGGPEPDRVRSMHPS